MRLGDMKAQLTILFVCVFGLAFVLIGGKSDFSIAQETALSHSENTAASNHSFVKRHYSISGNATLVETETGTEIVFSDDFETRSGPDLKVYLSKLPLSQLKDKNVDENSLKIGVLKSKQGAQSYSLPKGVSLTEYKSVVIHCEAFSKLWGGFDIN